MTMIHNHTRNLHVPTMPRLVLALRLAGRQIAEWHRRHRIMLSYERMSDEMLRDIGLTRSDLDEALAMPLTQDASGSLEQAAAESGKW